jgi:hypothetical protein
MMKSGGLSRDMKCIYRRAKDEAHYNATLFLRMLSEVGPFETAERLVTSNAPSDGFTALWERGRLDLTVEALVLQPRYRGLFDDDLLDAARRRLAEYGYDVTSEVPEARESAIREDIAPAPPAPPPSVTPAAAPAGWFRIPIARLPGGGGTAGHGRLGRTATGSRHAGNSGSSLRSSRPGERIPKAPLPCS